MSKQLKTILIIIGIVVVIGVMLAGRIISGYNNVIAMDENVKGRWAQVENQLKRRYDLIPNLVETVKGYAAHEKQTLTDVIEARNKALQTKIDVGSLNNEAKFEAFSKAQDKLSSVLSRLMVVVERYPDLKASQNFLALQSQLEGTENRIAVERKRYNEAVRSYNTMIKRFPTNMIASAFGFDKVTYFKSAPEAATVPKVEF